MQNQAAEQVVKTLKEANNVLVTVKNSPTVDELTAAIGLTLILNRMDKHAITVFSGRVPSTLEFLQPEMAIDSTTDSLRDFIIALDKSKADKLRYKVEDNVVRIFITPYKSSITEKDLEFSQGDFNVDAVVALGVVAKEDFDQAVTAHGRILHDATVLALTNHEAASTIGAINWQEQNASSISEMITSITDQLGPDVLDGQIATSLLTGIVSETDRFKNSNTTPQVLTLSSKLMSAGANQQLIAEKLEAPDMNTIAQPITEDYENTSDSDGALEIDHDEDVVQKIHIDDSGNLELPVEESLPTVQEHNDDNDGDEDEDEDQPESEPSRSYIQTDKKPKLFGQDDSGTETEQPLFNENLHAHDTSNLNSTQQQELQAHKQKRIEPLPSIDEKPQEIPQPIIGEPASPPDEAVNQTAQPMVVNNNPVPPTQAPQATNPASDDDQTLTDLEQAVGSPHVNANDATNVDDFLGTSRPAAVTVSEPAQEPEQKEEPVDKQTEPVQPAEEATPPAPTPQVVDSTAPPAVPPPLMPQAPSQPQFFDADGSNSNPFLNPNQ